MGNSSPYDRRRGSASGTLGAIGLAAGFVIVAAAALLVLGPSAQPSPSPTPASNVLGFPAAIGGEPVLLGREIEARVAVAVDDTPFLIGGVLSEAPFGIECLSPILPPTDPGLVNTCTDPYLLSAYVALYLSRYHPGATDIGKLHDLVVYRVHVRDPLAGTCSAATPDWQQQCLDAIVIEKVVWWNGSLVDPL
jgi:hypothetical protein